MGTLVIASTSENLMELFSKKGDFCEIHIFIRCEASMNFAKDNEMKF